MPQVTENTRSSFRQIVFIFSTSQQSLLLLSMPIGDSLIMLDNFIIMKKDGPKRQKRYLSKQEEQAQQIHLMDNSEQAKQRRHVQMVNNLNRQNIHRYLDNLDRDKDHDEMVNKITHNSMLKIADHLKQGELTITENPPPMPIKTDQNKRLSTEEQKDVQFKLKNELIHKKIEYLYDQIKTKTSKDKQLQGLQGQLEVQFKDILTKQEHEKRVKDIITEKASRRRKYEEILQEEKRKNQEQQVRKEQMKKFEQQKAKQIKRGEIEQKIKRRKSQHEKFVELESKLHKHFSQMKNKPRIYQEMQKRYESEMMLPILQQRKNKLKEIRDFHLRFSVEQIKEHEKEYLKKSKEKTMIKRENSAEWKYLPPPRSERMTKLLQNEETQLKEKLQERKKKNEQKQKRQQLYRLQIKQKYMPKIDENKKQQIERRYFEQQRKKERIHSVIDRNRIGEAYLQMAKKMKRSDSATNKQLQDSALIQPEMKTQSQTKVQRSNEYYQEKRRKNIDNILSSEKGNKEEKCLLLQRQSDKLIQKIRQKEQLSRIQDNQEVRQEATELILTSIKAKMGIMYLLKDQQNEQQG